MGIRIVIHYGQYSLLHDLGIYYKPSTSVKCNTRKVATQVALTLPVDVLVTDFSEKAKFKLHIVFYPKSVIETSIVLSTDDLR